MKANECRKKRVSLIKGASRQTVKEFYNNQVNLNPLVTQKGGGKPSVYILLHTNDLYLYIFLRR